MPRSARRSIPFLAVGLLLLAGAGRARAEGGERALLFARKTSLWRMTLGGRPVELAKLGGRARDVGSIQVAPDGSAALVDVGGEPLWVDLESRETAKPPCRGEARLSRDGRFVLCRRSDGAAVVYRVEPERTYRAVPGVRAPGVQFFAGHRHLAFADEHGIWKAPVGRSRRRQLLAPHVPKEVSVSPDGRRAVATFREKGGLALYSFRLNGRGVRRRLMLGVRPVAWSVDSRWVVVQGKNRACVVRATGGHYRCWDGFRAQSVDGPVEHLLMTREGDLYGVPLEGTRRERPRRITRRAPAASWLP